LFEPVLTAGVRAVAFHVPLLGEGLPAAGAVPLPVVVTPGALVGPQVGAVREPFLADGALEGPFARVQPQMALEHPRPVEFFAAVVATVLWPRLLPVKVDHGRCNKS